MLTAKGFELSRDELAEKWNVLRDLAQAVQPARTVCVGWNEIADGPSGSRPPSPRLIDSAACTRGVAPWHTMNLPTEIFGNVIVVHTPEELGTDQADISSRCWYAGAHATWSWTSTPRKRSTAAG